MENKKDFTKKFDVKPSTEAGFSLDTNFGYNEKTAYERDEKLDYYFESYSHFGIHEEMLKDEVRTFAYMRSMVRNKHLFKDKIVMDVGCGTGILSMFAVEAGAKHVYAVDMANILDKAKCIVEENGMSDKITCIKGKIEEIEIGHEKVDIIISEWMGYFLLYEGMLDSVIYARDKWLVPDGLIFPDRVVMFLAGVEDEKYLCEKDDYWDNVYGYKMSCAKNQNKNDPLVDTINTAQINTTPCPFYEIDIKKTTIEELNFASCFEVKATRDDTLSGFVTWFECYFTDCHLLERLDTSPYGKYTHWKQTVFYFDSGLLINNGETITGNIAARKNKRNPRQLDVKLWAGVYDKRSKNRITRDKFFIMR